MKKLAVEVNGDDPAFNKPGKRIGKTCTGQEAIKLNKEKGWILKISGKHIPLKTANLHIYHD